MTTSRYKLMLGASLLTLFPIAWMIYPYVIVPSNVTVCLFKTLTDRDCPFCGLTRALASAMHGDFQAAMGYHPLWWLASLLIAGTGVLAFLDGISNDNRLENLRSKTKFLDVYIILALIVFWLIRELT